MASTRPPATGVPGRRSTDPFSDHEDWPAQAADTIERVVQDVRAKTTGPAINAARWAVAGTFLAIAGTMALVLVLVLLVRVLNVYIPDAWVGDDHVWFVYLLLGGSLSIAGLVILSRRHPRTARG